MKEYYRIILGAGSVYAEECHKGNFIGTDYGKDIDLTGQLPEDWEEFRELHLPTYREKYPDKNKVAIGHGFGTLWLFSIGINNGDIVLCPDNLGNYMVAEVISDYSYHQGEILPHRREVRWYPQPIERSAMSAALQSSTAGGIYSTITKYAAEIEQFLDGKTPSPITSTDETIEDPSVFALEKHLEDFLVKNWQQTELASNYDIFEDEGELVGQQYQTDTGPIDILAISKDKKELLVVELKKGRASDVVVGQIQRYMGFVLEELAEPDQEVKGIIIALEDDVKIKRALAVAQNIEFYKYEVSFKLHKG